MKPTIVYVDDEPNNLTIFESTVPEDWNIHVFDNPLTALEQIEKINPWVIAADQRMPGMVGVKFLEIARKLTPAAKRVLITGFSDEDLVIESVRTAQVSDYIRKPWDADDLEIRMQKVVESYLLETELKSQQAMLEAQNIELISRARELETAKQKEERIRKELEAWVPPFILNSVEAGLKFPLCADLALITFDIIRSSELHGKFVDNIPARTHILRAFSELIIKHGGWRESHAGDSAYGHFGLVDQIQRPADSALAVATEFRLFLRNFSQKYGIEVECGVGLHHAKSCLVEVHEVQSLINQKLFTQKSVDSTSSDVDLVHRMESFTHQLPGSNIVMSETFVSELSQPPPGIIELGAHQFKGQRESVKLFLKASDRVKREDLDKLGDPLAPTLKIAS